MVVLQNLGRRLPRRIALKVKFLRGKVNVGVGADGFLRRQSLLRAAYCAA